MAVTTDDITKMLENVIELLKIDDDEKIGLAIDILTLVINYIGAENIMEALGDGVKTALEHVSAFISGENSELSMAERTEALALTRRALDDLFEKMAVAG